MEKDCPGDSRYTFIASLCVKFRRCVVHAFLILAWSLPTAAVQVTKPKSYQEFIDTLRDGPETEHPVSEALLKKVTEQTVSAANVLSV
jgi:hypothetical protein